eukprot:TRINITY_DN23234_c0_g1_i1.p1 TRINITY_DN23234_c0_g1~~TRINITY_DN23234_c0_g1_i1.p1  ORF type:complete len:666 (+),score=185.07 TRINITY_DN23234_c0_g1_i1:92-2089(+)
MLGEVVPEATELPPPTRGPWLQADCDAKADPVRSPPLAPAPAPPAPAPPDGGAERVHAATGSPDSSLSLAPSFVVMQMPLPEGAAPAAADGERQAAGRLAASPDGAGESGAPPPAAPAGSAAGDWLQRMAHAARSAGSAPSLILVPGPTAPPPQAEHPAPGSGAGGAAAGDWLQRMLEAAATASTRSGGSVLVIPPPPPPGHGPEAVAAAAEEAISSRTDSIQVMPLSVPPLPPPGDEGPAAAADDWARRMQQAAAPAGDTLLSSGCSIVVFPPPPPPGQDSTGAEWLQRMQQAAAGPAGGPTFSSGGCSILVVPPSPPPGADAAGDWAQRMQQAAAAAGSPTMMSSDCSVHFLPPAPPPPGQNAAAEDDWLRRMMQAAAAAGASAGSASVLPSPLQSAELAPPAAGPPASARTGPLPLLWLPRSMAQSAQSEWVTTAHGSPSVGPAEAAQVQSLCQSVSRHNSAGTEAQDSVRRATPPECSLQRHSSDWTATPSHSCTGPCGRSARAAPEPVPTPASGATLSALSASSPPAAPSAGEAAAVPPPPDPAAERAAEAELRALSARLAAQRGRQQLGLLGRREQRAAGSGYCALWQQRRHLELCDIADRRSALLRGPPQCRSPHRAAAGTRTASPGPAAAKHSAAERAWLRSELAADYPALLAAAEL